MTSPRIEISSISVSRIKAGVSFEKYNIDVSIDEIENNDSGIKLEYKFVLLSNPNNAKISISGMISILGDENEVTKYLEPDERNIPIIVNIAYQEILPLLYVLTKSIDIPCPAYKISQISQTIQSQSTEPRQNEEMQISKQSETIKEEYEEVQPSHTPSMQSPTEEAEDVLDELEKLVERQNVSSN